MLFPLIVDYECAKQACAQHIGYGIERKVWIPELDGKEEGHDKSEEHYRTVSVLFSV